MTPEEYRLHDALSLAELVSNGQIDPAALLSAARAAVESTDNTINAVVTPMWSEAEAAIASGLPQGPFHGVPFLLKDLGQYYTGVVTSNGSRFFRTNVADHDSTLVQRYRNAGLVICGKTNTPELGLATTTEPVLHGPTRNPWNQNYSTGGSSGGAAAAVAAGYVPMAHASDGGGSVRIPASCCGLFGLKPTRARVPLGPDGLEGWGGLSTVHAITRSVRDSAALLDCSAGEEPGSPYFAPPAPRSYLAGLTQAPGKLRIGLCLTPFNAAPIDAEVKGLTETAARRIEALGHEVSPAAPPISGESLRDAHGVIAVSHVGATVDARAAQLGRAPTEDDLEVVTWGNYQASRQISGADYAHAVNTIQQAGLIIARTFDDYDLLMTPTLACLPPKLGKLNMMSDDAETYVNLLYRMIGFTSIFNDTGNPAMSVPLSTSANGLPVGMQFVAPFGREALLLQLAAQLESAGLFTPALGSAALGSG